MRELKFRLWDAEAYLYSDSLTHIGLDSRSDKYKLLAQLSILFNTSNKYNVEDCIFQQFTGMKDKDGVDIYEGDILEWGMSYNKECPFPRLKFVEFYMPQLIYKAVDVGDLPAGVEYLYEAGPNSTRWCRVVGNIFENPELLNNV